MPESINTAIEDQQIIMAVEAGGLPPTDARAAGGGLPARGLRGLIERGLSTPSVEYSRGNGTAAAVRDGHAASGQPSGGAADAKPLPNQPSRTGRTPATRMFQGPWTSCGLPTITLPVGGGRSRACRWGSNWPAPYLGEGELLAAAAWCERGAGCEPGSTAVAAESAARLSQEGVGGLSYHPHPNPRLRGGQALTPSRGKGLLR